MLHLLEQSTSMTWAKSVPELALGTITEISLGDW
jgi:hypothetical protein